MAGRLSRRGFMGATMAGAATMVISESVSAANPSSSEPIPLTEALPLDALSTPALVVDADAMESNLKKMAEHGQSQGIGLRPHSKTHKCPIIAHKQIELGAIGICCAKVSEAEVMLDGGIQDILITSPVVTTEKIDRVIAIAKRSGGVQMVVDNLNTANDFNDAAKAAGITLRVLVDLDIGTRRTGVKAGSDAVKLVKEVDKLGNLQLDGLQAYAGHVMHIKGHESRSKMSISSMNRGLDVLDKLNKSGMGLEVFTGGGTGTFDIDCDLDGVSDLQVGSYLFMDVEYRAVGDKDGDVFDYFDPSLFVMVTTISKPVPRGSITVDAGYKSFASENVKPESMDVKGLGYQWFGDEHGMLLTSKAEREIELGEKIRMIVSHCDPTVNLYDYYHVYRDGMVRELWPIAARGKSQ